MKKRLFLFLSRADYAGNITIASTLAWLSGSKGCLFDNYYDSYHQGIHFPGGDSRNLELGQLTGGTVSGDRHFEEFYFLLHNFEVFIISPGESIFLSSIKNLSIPILALSDRINILYKKIFCYFDVPLPSNIVMIGSNFGRALFGLEAYLYPEIYYRQAIGVLDSISDNELADLYQEGGKIFCLYMNEKSVDRLKKNGYDVEIIDRLKKNDDYLSITKRVALRWKKYVKGWILGDPMLVAHWLPKACEEDLLSVYSVPQEKMISQLGELISSKGEVVYGRQYSDRDFFELSKLNQCLQVIDPYRPPFQSIKHVDYSWHLNPDTDGFFDPEYSDEKLKQFARENKILVSLMFWSGMIREVENFHNLMDLIAITRLKCGLVVTALSYEYMMHPPFELLTIPLDQGGVYPLVETVLGSCGIGVGVESYMTKDRLQENLKDGLSKILQKVKKESYLPRGWWLTMDTNLEKLNWWQKPKPVRLLRYSPYFQIRFKAKEKVFHENFYSKDEGIPKNIRQKFIESMKTALHEAGLTKYFEQYRPYEYYRAGILKNDIIETARAVGLKYMFTKAGFNSSPEAKYLDEDFIALNYTAGQWDGWTPFETINDVSDLRKAEKFLIKKDRPGWIVSTIDSCLWTFCGEFWKRGSKLFEIAQFCANGGNSRKLINVKPCTVARYARIIAEEI